MKYGNQEGGLYCKIHSLKFIPLKQEEKTITKEEEIFQPGTEEEANITTKAQEIDENIMNTSENMVQRNNINEIFQKIGMHVKKSNEKVK